ncbi:hypothetical protein EDD22DRAFT_1031340 [Suillus occidentalis]|nr:hypothetical protein EDD22DRAFT_1031340 [Suillus occidentalis]
MAMFVSAACVCSRGSSTDNNFRLPTRCLQIDYIFGGFNFLMWIAFVVTTLSYKPLEGASPVPVNLGVAVLLMLVIIISTTFYAFVDWNASRIMNPSSLSLRTKPL